MTLKRKLEGDPLNESDRDVGSNIDTDEIHRD